MPKMFSDEEKKVIVRGLLNACKKNWAEKGYKSTKISTLCQSVNISKGAFYIFFESKEDIFYQVFRQTQKDLYENIEKHLSNNQNKSGIVYGMKEVFDIYCSSPYIYDTQSLDFKYFIGKLDKKQCTEMNDTTYELTKFLFQKPFLKFKIDKNLAISLFTVMLSTVSQKDNLLYDKKKVFDFIIDNLINEIFE